MNRIRSSQSHLSFLALKNGRIWKSKNKLHYHGYQNDNDKSVDKTKRTLFLFLLHLLERFIILEKLLLSMTFHFLLSILRLSNFLLIGWEIFIVLQEAFQILWNLLSLCCRVLWVVALPLFLESMGVDFFNFFFSLCFWEFFGLFLPLIGWTLPTLWLLFIFWFFSIHWLLGLLFFRVLFPHGEQKFIHSLFFCIFLHVHTLTFLGWNFGFRVFLGSHIFGLSLTGKDVFERFSSVLFYPGRLQIVSFNVLCIFLDRMQFDPFDEFRIHWYFLL